MAGNGIEPDLIVSVEERSCASNHEATIQWMENEAQLDLGIFTMPNY